MKQLNTSNAKVLEENKVKIALCTDHPVIPVQYLTMSGAIAIKNGLDRYKALEAITINAAEICNISDRVGSIKAGKDADLCLFEGDPFDVMVSPALVLINGEAVKK